MSLHTAMLALEPRSASRYIMATSVLPFLVVATIWGRDIGIFLVPPPERLNGVVRRVTWVSFHFFPSL